MSKFKTMVKNDIVICDKFIEVNFAKYSDVQALLGKYLIDYPDFNKGIIGYASIPGRITNEIENIKIIKGKLEYLLNRVDNPDLYNKPSSSGTTIVNTNNNTNTNTNTVTLNMSIDEIRDNITDNTYLSDDAKEELLDKLDEIIELQKNKESKAKKWDKAKSILAFLLDTGADIAIMYIPQILLAINS